MFRALLLKVFAPLAIVGLLGILGPPFPTNKEERSKDVLIAKQTSTIEKVVPLSSCSAEYHPYQWGVASWYGPKFHGRTMANGHRFNMNARTVAHRTLRLGTRVCITNPENGRSVEATVTDRGPYVDGRIVDLSKRIADELDITELGIERVEIGVHKNTSHRVPIAP